MTFSIHSRGQDNDAASMIPNHQPLHANLPIFDRAPHGKARKRLVHSCNAYVDVVLAKF